MKALGIDLGTTKVALVIYDDMEKLQAVASAAHGGAVSVGDPAAFEQDAEKIISCAADLMKQLPAGLLAEVDAVGITGQMHSLLLKNDRKISNLVTWQDHRCGREMIDMFNSKSGLELREGFGGTTLARMALEGTLENGVKAASICDYLAAELTGSWQFITDPTFAASWGIYDRNTGEWAHDALEKLNIPLDLLPEIRPCGAVTGYISEEFSRRSGLPVSAKVINSIGDNQASIAGTGKSFEDEIYLTLGTGAQLSVVTDNFSDALPENIELRPFPGGRQLLVSAPLCGGAAFAFLADTVNRFREELGENSISRSELLDTLDHLGMKYISAHGEPEIIAEPHFLGERYAPEARGVIRGLTLENASPGALAAALAWGIVRNLKHDFPEKVLRGKKVVIGSGNAVRLVKCIQHAIKKEFSLDLILAEGREEAAVGAAKLALGAIRR